MIPVTKPYLPPLKKLNAQIRKIYNSEHLTNKGPMLKELEQRLTEYLGVRNLILVNNGSLALQVAYKALDLKGEVITTPFSFVATTSTQVWEGLTPVFADINSNSLNMDPDNIEPLITEKTSAIVPVHVYGNPCEVEQIQKIADKYNLKVIYDAAHAFGVKYKGQSVLNFGDISTLSFHATKLFHTIEGGAVVTEDDELARKIRLLINFGISGPEKVESVGTNAKMNEFQAAMGLCVLDDMNVILKKRKYLHDTYVKKLKGSLKMPQWNSQGSANYGYFPVLFESEEKLLAAQQRLNENEIYPRRYFYPSLNSLGYLESSIKTPVSEDICRRVLCLPVYVSLSKKDVNGIVEIILS